MAGKTRQGIGYAPRKVSKVTSLREAFIMARMNFITTHHREPDWNCTEGRFEFGSKETMVILEETPAETRRARAAEKLYEQE